MSQEQLSMAELGYFVKRFKNLPRVPHYNTLRRWILKGSRGRKLDAELIAGRWYTTPQAVREFLDAPAAPINQHRRKTAAQREADRQAERLGV